MAPTTGRAHTGDVQTWGSTFSYAYGPLGALAGIVVFAVLLRWAFSRGASLVEPPRRPGAPSEYGLLTPVASPTTYVEGEMLRRTLEASSVKATLATTNDGPRVLVWPGDVDRAREVLSRRRA
ncbi:MAG: hypothetical protein WAN48_09650 [Actinomycetes bacterium]